jgi:hypothetical protein
LRADHEDWPGEFVQEIIVKCVCTGKFPDGQTQFFNHWSTGQALIDIASQENPACTIHASSYPVFGFAVMDGDPDSHLGSADRRELAHAFDGFVSSHDATVAFLERGNDRRAVTGSDFTAAATNGEIDAVHATFYRAGGFLLAKPGDKAISTDDFRDKNTKMF